MKLIQFVLSCHVHRNIVRNTELIKTFGCLSSEQNSVGRFVFESRVWACVYGVFREGDILGPTRVLIFAH